jgi:methylmalonyl-CoA mutase cobalamin-binding subunit
MTTKLDGLLPPDLPDANEVLEAGRDIGRSVTCGVSLLCREHGVRNELEYKRKMQAEGRVMQTLDIGMQDWDQTARALEKIHEGCQKHGFRVDRYQLIIDRRMGLPRDQWETAPKETGPMMMTPADWLATTNTVPMQPHMGDYMIGSPMSVSNACAALEAGVTYIGNIGQFAWKYPGWNDEVAQMVEMVKAVGIVSTKRGQAICHTYLDDGFPAQFRDYSSYIGWALFERYVVETLCGADLSIAYGGLTNNPITKVAMIIALERLRPIGSINAYYHGTTTAYTADIEKNYGVLGVDTLHTCLAQLHTKNAAAVQTTPVYEAVRVPSWEEIVEAQTIAFRVSEDARRVYEYVNWDPIERIADKWIEGGRTFFENIVDGLAGAGVDISDPLQVMLAVRRLGAVTIENRWGIGTPNDDAVGGYDAIFPTDTFSMFVEARNEMLLAIPDVPNQGLKHVRCIVGSTDVHEFGMFIVVEAMRAIGIEPVVAGTSLDPDEFADLALEVAARVLIVSTHNGMALTYGRQLQVELAARGLEVRVFMGGTLNQDFEGVDTPVDVRDDLIAEGIHACREINEMIELLRATV